MQAVNNLTEVIQRASETNFGVRFIEGDKQELFLAYKDLYKNSLGLLDYLQSLHIQPGDELVFQFKDNQKFIHTFVACLLGGIIAVPINVAFSKYEQEKLKQVFNVLKKPRIITEDAFQMDIADTLSLSTDYVISYDAFNIGEQAGNIYPAHTDDIAYIQFSSGSTGSPKGCMLTHENLITNIRDIIHSSHVTSSDQLLGWVPLTHDLGLIGSFLTPLYTPMTSNLMSTTLFIRRPYLWMKKVSQHRATLSASPNFGYRFFCKRFKAKLGVDWDLSCLRLIFNGAEPISALEIERFLKLLKPYHMNPNVMYPVYGMAEACLGIAFPVPSTPVEVIHFDRNSLSVGRVAKKCQPTDDYALALVSEGYPMTSTKIKISNDALQEVEEGTVGHILVKGKNIMKGYYQNPEETKKALTMDGWLKTGDIGLILDGKAIVVGRAKDVVIVNGQKYHAHDIEDHLGQVLGIDSERIVVTSVIKTTENKEAIVLFVRHNRDVEKFVEVINHTQQSIMHHFGFTFDYVLPTHKILKTTSSKKQRYLMREQFENGIYDDVIKILEIFGSKQEVKLKQESELREEEHAIQQIWQTIMDTSDTISLEGHFFELGGDSLKATQLSNEIEEKFEVEFPIPLILSNPTIKQQAALLKKLPSRKKHIILKEKTSNSYPLTPIQKRIFVASKVNEDILAFNIPVAIKLYGNLDAKKLEYAIEQLIKRHDILRTSFKEVNGIPQQFVHESVNCSIETGLTSEKEISQTIRAFIRPFNIEKPGLFRIGLYKVKQNVHLFILDTHHLISDGTSISLFMTEIEAIYADKRVGLMSYQYKDYAYWNSQNIKEDFSNKQFWLEQFTRDIEELYMPLDYPKQGVTSYRGSRVFFEFPSSIIESVEQIALQYNVTAYTVICSVFQVFLYQYTGQEKITTLTPIAGRVGKASQDIIGPFINVLPIVNRIQSSMNFGEVVERTREFLYQSYDHQRGFDFDTLVEHEEIDHVQLSSLLQSNMFVFQNFQKPVYNDWTYKLVEVPSTTTQYDLLLSITTMHDEWHAFFEYSIDIYEEETITGFSRQFITLIQQITKDPTMPLQQLKRTNTEDNKQHEVVSFEGFEF